jgi:hypothetical protein
MGKDLLCKLRAQITFDSDGITALKLRGPEAKALTLMVMQSRKCSSMPLREGLLKFLSFRQDSRFMG